MHAIHFLINQPSFTRFSPAGVSLVVFVFRFDFFFFLRFPFAFFARSCVFFLIFSIILFSFAPVSRTSCTKAFSLVFGLFFCSLVAAFAAALASFAYFFRIRRRFFHTRLGVGPREVETPKLSFKLSTPWCQCVGMYTARVRIQVRSLEPWIFVQKHVKLLVCIAHKPLQL